MAQVVLVAFILYSLHSQLQSTDVEKTTNLTSVDAGGWVDGFPKSVTNITLEHLATLIIVEMYFFFVSMKCG